MAKPLSVFVNIGAKVGSSVGASASAVERRFAKMGRSLKLQAAEARAALRGIEAGAGKRRGDLFEAGALAYGLNRALKPAIEFEDALTRVGNIADVHGAKLEGAGKDTIKAGRAFGVGGRAALEGVNDFIAAGLDLNTATGALRPTLMLARTAGIETEEAASAGIGAMQNMGVEVKDLGLAFDAMAKAGKEGKFELKDMARYMPRLTSSAAKMGLAGVKGVGDIAAMLQVVRMGAADAEQAQNNLYNLFEKVFSGETVKKFAKQGVDLQAMYAEAEASGRSYFDMVLDKVDELSQGGKDPFAFSASFEDQQARSALQMLVLHRDEYRRIRDAVRQSAGVLERDWARVQKTSAAGTARFKASLEGLGIQLGRTLLPVLASGANAISGFLDGVADFADRYPGMATGLTAVGVGLVAYRVAAVGAAWVTGILNAQLLATKINLLALGGGILTGVTRGLVGMRNAALTAGFALKWGGIRGAGALFLTMLNPLKLVTGALRVLRLAVIGTGIGALLVGIALAGMWIANNWKGIGAFFTAFGKAFMAGIAPVRPALEPMIGLFKGALDFIEKLVGPISVERWTAWGTAVGTAIGGVVKTMVEFVDWIGKGATAIGDFFSRGKGEGAAPGVKVAGARARGGPVWGRAPFLVGERGPELFVPPGRGRIMAAGATAAALAATAVMPAAAAPAAQRPAMGDVTIVIQGAADPAATAREVERVLKRMASEQSALYSD